MKKTRVIAFFELVSFVIMCFYFQGCTTKTPDAGRIVPANLAKSRVAGYRARRDTLIKDPRLQGAFFYSAEVFTKNDLEAILSESKCDGIRIFHAVDSLGRNILLITGVAKTARGYEDLLPKTLSAGDRVGAAIYDEDYNIIMGNIRCPNMCDLEGLAKP